MEKILSLAIYIFMDNTNYYNQYLKYKNKYLQLKKNQKGGSSVGPFEVGETYYLKGEGEILKSNKKIQSLSTLAEYNIDSFGFSQKEPNYFFQITTISFSSTPTTSTPSPLPPMANACSSASLRSMAMPTTRATVALRTSPSRSTKTTP